MWSMLFPHVPLCVEPTASNRRVDPLQAPETDAFPPVLYAGGGAPRGSQAARCLREADDVDAAPVESVERVPVHHCRYPGVGREHLAGKRQELAERRRRRPLLGGQRSAGEKQNATEPQTPNE